MVKMPPKAKGKKKKGKKKAGASDASAKNEEEVLTFTEAVLVYQLQSKQKHLEELSEDLKNVQHRNTRQKERNHQLKLERQRYMKEAINQARELEKKMMETTKVTFEQVEEALKEKLATARKEEEEVKALKDRISQIKRETEKYKKEIDYFTYYRDRVQYDRATHIHLLKKEMEDMKSSYDELADFFEKNLANIKEQIEKSMGENIDKQKHIASEQALESLDSSSHQEFSDNKWLQQEVEIHRQHFQDISSVVEQIEKRNLAIMEELLKQQFEDVRITRDFYEACNEASEQEYEETGTDNKVLVLVNDEETIAEHGTLSKFEETPDDLGWFDNYFPSFEDRDFEGSIRLGPLDLKLLCIVGAKKPIHRGTPEEEQIELDDIDSEKAGRKLEWLDKKALQNLVASGS